MRERVEDLGRLREKLNQILDSEVFEHASKHDEAFVQRFMDQDELESLRLQLQFVKERLFDCYAIAKGDEDE